MNKKKVKKFSTKRFLKKLWALLEPFRKTIYTIVFWTALLEGAQLVSPYFLKIIIDTLTDFQPEKIPLIVGLTFAMFAFSQITTFFVFLMGRGIFKLSAFTAETLNNNAHKKMMFLDLMYHEKENTGNKIIKIQRGTEKIQNLLINFFWDFFPATIKIIFTSLVLLWINWIFGVIVLFFSLIFTVLSFKANKNIFPSRKNRYDKQEEAAGIMTQSIININTVKSFVQESNESKGFGKLSKSIRKSFLKETLTMQKSYFVRNFVINCAKVLILLVGVLFAWQGSITIGSLVFIITISSEALNSSYRLTRIYDQIMENSEPIEKLHDLSREEPEIKNPKRGIVPKIVSGDICFENVSFIYKESGIKALKNVSVKINAGCVTALVGPSGGGKTTLARMIYRHYDPFGGKVLLDGKNLKEYDLYGFRKHIAIVPQEVEVFNTSIKDNISYAKPEASFKEIKAAAQIANAENFIEELSEKYETMVGERGIKLSGGQRQRLGIARAILANPKILIFDEATSNLDSESESLIQKAMDRISRNRTVVIIAHRLSTIKKADKIIVLEKGRVAQQGSHIELAQTKGGLYKKLIDLQKLGDVE
ncbi:MAG: ABC transporter ATP-binding protein [Patescibacteria group bacterium]|nr:ABC transporter ATP-binding protein [Patescibacteria group bacterium]